MDKLILEQKMKKTSMRAACMLLVFVSLLLGGCSGNVGVGVSVGIPIGDHGYMSVGGTRWH